MDAPIMYLRGPLRITCVVASYAAWFATVGLPLAYSWPTVHNSFMFQSTGVGHTISLKYWSRTYHLAGWLHEIHRLDRHLLSLE